MLCRAAALLAAFVLPGCTEGDGTHVLAALPPAIGAEAVEFARNETWGFGPGANETGLNVIRLGDAGARHAATGGTAWLNAQPGGRIWPEWSETPVPRDDFWMGQPDSAAGSYPDPTVDVVLDRYGFGVAVPEYHRLALDTALNSPGSFYAFGPGGLVAVIVPAKRRAYVFHAG